MSNARYDTNVDDMDYFTFCAQTTFGDVLENPGIPDVVEKAVEENPEMDDPDFDPMGEDLYDVIDEHEFKFNRSTKVSQKEVDLLLQVCIVKSHNFRLDVFKYNTYILNRDSLKFQWLCLNLLIFTKRFIY